MVGNMTELADILYCKIRCLPMTYLSVPFGPSFKVKSVWHPILEKMYRRLAVGRRYNCQKGEVNSIEGYTLKSSYLLLSFLISLFTITTSVAHRILKRIISRD